MTARVRYHDPRCAAYAAAFTRWLDGGEPGPRPRCNDYALGWQTACLVRWVVLAARSAER